jgi:hypothetical protein
MAGVALLVHSLTGVAASTPPSPAARLLFLLAYLVSGAAVMAVTVAAVGTLLPAAPRRATATPGATTTAAGPVAAENELDDELDDEDDDEDEDDETAEETQGAQSTEATSHTAETEAEVAAAWKRPGRRRKSDPIDGQVGFW